MNEHTSSDTSHPDLPPPVPTSVIVDEVPTGQTVEAEPADAELTTVEPAEAITVEPNPSAANETGPAAVDEPGPAGSAAPSADIDLHAIERDLNDVQTALERLNEGTYWTDEVTAEKIPDDVLAAFPLTRTVAGNTPS